jgi:hypothetical protein
MILGSIGGWIAAGATAVFGAVWRNRVSIAKVAAEAMSYAEKANQGHWTNEQIARAARVYLEKNYPRVPWSVVVPVIEGICERRKAGAAKVEAAR